MARIRRSELPDGYFHVYARGVDGTDIYLDDDDRRTFVDLAYSARRTYGWDMVAMCLMTNHYHLVLEAARERLSRGMQWLNGFYAQLFNERHDRRGHLFGGRFGCRTIDSAEYLRQTCIYVVENPVRAGLCERLSDWPWTESRYLP